MLSRFSPLLASSLQWIVFLIATTALLCTVGVRDGFAQTDNCDVFVNAGSGSGSGTQTDPHTSLSTGLSSTPTDGTLCVTGETYATGGSAFTLQDGATLKGAYAEDFSTRDVNGTPTVLDGEDASRVLQVSGNGNFVVDGVTIANGNAGSGGGFHYNYASANSLTFQNVTFTSNTADTGGALYARGISSTTLTNVVFINNEADAGDGGAVYFDASNEMTITNLLAQGNRASGDGGALYIGRVSPLEITNATISGNYSGGEGGGIHTTPGSESAVSNSILWSNRAGGGFDQIRIPNGSDVFFYSSNVEGSGGSGTWNTSLAGSNPSAVRDGGDNIDDDPFFDTSVPTPLSSTTPTTDGTLRVQTDSPVLNSGDDARIDLTEVPTDIEGEDRRQGPYVDMGAYEGGVEPSVSTIIRVDKTDPQADDGNDGRSWDEPLATIGQAIADAESPAEIWIAGDAGTTVYYPDTGPNDADDVAASFTLKNRVSIYGGFQGTEANREDREPKTYRIVLSGDLTQNDTDPDGDGIISSPNDINDSASDPNARHVVTADGVSARTELSGFTITAGVADGDGAADGNGVASDDGGGLLAQDGSPKLTNLRIVGNRAAGNGGGLATVNGDGGTTLRNVVVENNEATGTSANGAGSGGGLWIDGGSTPELIEATVESNDAAGDGGGLHINNAGLRLVNATIAGNEAAGDGGGVAAIGPSFSSFINAVIRGNHSGETAGGIYMDGSSSENQIDLRQATIHGNNANNEGYAIHIGGQGSIRVLNAIVYENGGTPQLQEYGGSIDPTNMTTADPSFLTPVDPSSAPTTDGNLRIQPSSSSPAIDAGDFDTGGQAPLDFADLDGDGRTTEVLPVDRGHNQRVSGSSVDLGAYEGTTTELRIVGTSDDQGNAATGTQGSDAGWRLVGPPYSGVEAQDLTSEREAALGDDQLIEFGLDSGDMLWTWDESNQETVTASATTPLANGRAAWLYLFDDAGTPDADPIGAANGSPNPMVIRVNDVTVSDRRTTDTDVDVDGLSNATGDYNFLANPYPSGYDLEQLQDDGTNSSTYQVWDPYDETFENVAETANDSDGDGMEDDVIAPWQGFVAQRTSSDGPTTLTFGSSGTTPGPSEIVGSLNRKSTSAAPYRRLDLRLRVDDEAGDEVARDDALSLLFRPGDSETLRRWHAKKITPLVSDYATLSIHESTESQGDTLLAAKGLPSILQAPRTLDLALTSAGVSGTATISAPQWTNIPDDWSVTLIDTKGTADNHDDEQVLLDRTGTDYEFTLPSPSQQQEKKRSAASGRGGSAPPLRPLTESSTAASARPSSKESTPPSRFRLRVESGKLPVELTRFDATRDDRNAVLRWATAQETNNAGYAVQHRAGSTDDGTFERIGYVEGAGTTSESQSYRFVARDLGIGRHTFRLKQVDRSGTASFSDSTTVAIRLTEDARVTPPSPNPVRSSARLRVTVREAQPVRTVLYDVLGRQVRVMHDAQIPARDPHTIRLDGDDLSSGTYFVRVTGREFSKTRRLTVVR